MDKFEYKEKLIRTLSKLDEIHAELSSPETDNETGEMRADVLHELYELYDVIKEQIYNIY